jgi:hypothetical protein
VLITTEAMIAELPNKNAGGGGGGMPSGLKGEIPAGPARADCTAVLILNGGGVEAGAMRTAPFLFGINPIPSPARDRAQGTSWDVPPVAWRIKSLSPGAPTAEDVWSWRRSGRSRHGQTDANDPNATSEQLPK